MIDLERCFGCKSCEAACKQEHHLKPGTYRNKVVWLGNENSPDIDFFTLTCQHCERPACLRSCPVNPKAITKDEETGVVKVHEELCTGCGECILSCPYSAMGFDGEGHHSVKCDLCSERRENELEPACSIVCPGYAITFGERSELLKIAKKQERVIKDVDSFLLKPQTIYLERLKGPSSSIPIMEKNHVQNRIRSQKSDFKNDPISPKKLEANFPFGFEKNRKIDTRIEPGGCNICFNCCTTKFHFEDDKLVQITGNDEDPVLEGKICPKAQFGLQLHHNKKRLLTPLKRVGKRGENKFEKITWEQALDEIAEKLRQLKEKWGPEALAIFIGTRTGILTQKGYTRLFSQLWGTHNIEGTDPFCASGKTISYQITQGVNGSGNSYTPTDLGSAEMYLYVGDNQAETRPVYFGKINDWRVKNKAKMVVIDPRQTVTASKADKWLPIRPGTDMALALSIAHEVFSKNLHDAKFCNDWVLGWEEWKEFIFEKDYSPEWASEIIDLPQKEIELLASEIANSDGCVIFASRGINQHMNSLQTNRAWMFVSAITGNWGRKGGAYFNMTAGPPISPNAPLERREKINRPKIRKSPVGWLNAMKHEKPYPVKGMISSSNPLAQWPDQNNVRDALRNLDLLVHIELFQNETSAFADYVLPAATGIEKGEIGRSNDDRRIVWIDKLIDPPGEAKPDGWIWIELGKRLGFNDVLKEEYKDPKIFWDEMCIQNDFLSGVTQKRLHSVPYRWVRYPVKYEDSLEQETLYLEGTTAVGQSEGKRFPTKSGKLEFWTKELEDKFNCLDLSALPEFYSDPEILIDLPFLEIEDNDERLDVISPFFDVPTGTSKAKIVSTQEGSLSRSLREKGFNTELITGRPPAPHFHSWTHYFWEAQEMWPDLFCQIHPEHARALNIEDGEIIEVESAHGKITARAYLYRGIRKNSVFIPIGWGEKQPYNPWFSVNFLTSKEQRDPISGQTNLKSLLCKIKKI